jgi:hypothetical protein
MKNILFAALLLFIIGNICAIDTESYEFIDHLLSITAPGNPEIFEDAVIFSASSKYKRVGISFAHEDFAEVYWFRNLLVLQEIVPSGENAASENALGPIIEPADSGILFYTFPIPLGMQEIAYRLVIDGLWTSDPYNPHKKLDVNSGLEYSLVAVPNITRNDKIEQDKSGKITFKYNGPPGEKIMLAGNFNAWDPYMYQMKEITSGVYNLTLSLPPGLYHYVFFHRGERILDPINDQKIYTKEGIGASEIRIY